jgi:hypothetical protein
LATAEQLGALGERLRARRVHASYARLARRPRHPSFERQRRNKGVTEIVKIPDRGHALTIDGGWQEVADAVLAFVKRFV